MSLFNELMLKKKFCKLRARLYNFLAVGLLVSLFRNKGEKKECITLFPLGRSLASRKRRLYRRVLESTFVTQGAATTAKDDASKVEQVFNFPQYCGI